MVNIRIGVVPYMNAKPLICGLEKQPDKIDLSYNVPSALPEMLENDELDVILMPSVNYFRGTGYEIISGSSISSNGPVESVKLFIRTPSVEKIKVVALDKDSLTSCVLTKIILWKKYSLKPEFVTLDDKSKIYNEYADAFLIIGDNAMKIDDKDFLVLDLGLEWKELVGLPFVYAVWVTKEKSEFHGLGTILTDAKERGLKSLNEIANLESKRLKLGKEHCLKYLKESIKYDLGEQEIKGLKSFYNYAIEMGAANKGIKVEFYKG